MILNHPLKLLEKNSGNKDRPDPAELIPRKKTQATKTAPTRLS
jgi:hypothetical protein